MTAGKNIDLAQLELSMRTMDLLIAHGVSTLSEILALPQIHATPLSLSELRGIFSKFSVAYSGVLTSTANEIEVQVSGSVKNRWQVILAWLEKHHPNSVQEFHQPAKIVEIEKTETALGYKLPEDYRQFLQIHNGQIDNAYMVMTCSLFRVENLASQKQDYAAAFDEDTPPNMDADPGILPVQHSDGWIPIGVSARGRDYLCLDMTPTEHGQVGQVILTAIDFDEHEVLAPNFREFLSYYFNELQSGEIEFDD